MGCERARDSGVSAQWTLTWYLASVALLQGPPPAHDLVPGQNNDWPSGRGLWTYRLGLREETRHARDRFPGDSRFAFASGLAWEQEVHFWLCSRGVVLASPIARPTPGMYEAIGNLLTDAATDFAATQSMHDPETEAKAELHLGAIRYFQYRGDEALRLWDHVASGRGDESTRYLAFAFAGRVLAAEHPDAAIETFRRALDLRPDANSSLLSLASLLYLRNERDEAGRRVEIALAGDAGRDDPWWGYLRGDYARFPDRLQAVRRGLQ